MRGFAPDRPGAPVTGRTRLLRRPVVVALALALLAGGAVVVGSQVRSCGGCDTSPPPGSASAPPGAVPGPAATGPSSADRGPLPSAADLGVRSVASWQSRFADEWARSREDAYAWSRSGDSWNHYRLGFYLDALTAMYRATGERQYLDEALALSEDLVDTARPSSALPTSQYRDDYRGWVSRSRAEAGGREVPLYESVAWRYVTTLLRVMHEHGDDRDDAYRERYDRLFAFAEEHVFDKWYDRGASEHIYRSNTHMVAHWALIATNLAELTDDAERRARYARVIRDINYGLPNYDASLRGQMRAHPADSRAYFWDDEWSCDCPPGSDVAHANGVVAYVVEAEAYGRAWTRTDMSRFVRTLDEVVWPREGPPAEYLDGSGDGTGWFSDGFVKLGRYDVALQRRLESHEPANVQFVGNAALNVRLLQEARAGEAGASG